MHWTKSIRPETKHVLATILICLVVPNVSLAQRHLSASTIFADAKPSVVLIIAGSSNGKQVYQGSGFIIARNRIVTNHHVVAGTSDAMVVFSDGTTASVKNVIADSASKDLIVLGVNTGDRPSLPLGDAMSLKQGDTVYAIGAPRGLELTLTNGIVSAFRNINHRFEIQTTAAINHGSSGGPLLNSQGKVVGITSALLTDTPGIYFSVSVGDLKRMLRTPNPVLLSFAEWANENQKSAGPAGNPRDQASSSSASTTEESTIQKLLQNGKFTSARTAIASFEAKNPHSNIVHLLNGELDERTGDTDDALRELGYYVKKNPSDTLGQFYYALTLYQDRDFVDALVHEKKSNELYPTAGDQPILALMYYSVRNYSKAESAAQNALKSDPKDIAALEVLAGVAYHTTTGKGNSWMQYENRLAILDPDSFWVHLSSALNAYYQNQVHTAVTEFKAAEKTDFPDSTPFLILGSWYDRASQFGAANDQIKAGLASIPDDPWLLNEGMFIALQTHEDTEAERRFEALEQDYPNAPMTQGAGCLYYYGIGQPQQALAYCARQISMSPDDETAYSNYGWAALDANKPRLALREFAQAYKIDRPHLKTLDKSQLVDLSWGFTIADYNSGDRKGAHKLLKLLRKQYPDAATITGLQQLPLLWSDTTISRIQAILMKWPK